MSGRVGRQAGKSTNRLIDRLLGVEPAHGNEADDAVSRPPRSIRPESQRRSESHERAPRHAPRMRSAAISRLLATQAVVLRAMLRAKNEPSSRLRRTTDEVEVELRRPAQVSPRPACQATFLRSPPETHAGGRGRHRSRRSFVCFATARRDAEAPPQEGVEVPSAQIRGRTQPEAPYRNGPLASPAPAFRLARRGASSVTAAPRRASACANRRVWCSAPPKVSGR